MVERAWWDRAACLEASIDWFFPERGGSVARAWAICASCSVTAECLEWALKFPMYADTGIWAGTSARERQRLRRLNGSG